MLYNSHENSNKTTDFKQNKRCKNCISIKTEWIAGKKWLEQLPYKCQKQSLDPRIHVKARRHGGLPVIPAMEGRDGQSQSSVWLRTLDATHKVEEWLRMTLDFRLELSYVYLYIHTKHAYIYRHHTTDTKMEHKNEWKHTHTHRFEIKNETKFMPLVL